MNGSPCPDNSYLASENHPARNVWNLELNIPWSQAGPRQACGSENPLQSY